MFLNELEEARVCEGPKEPWSWGSVPIRLPQAMQGGVDGAVGAVQAALGGTILPQQPPGALCRNMPHVFP